MNHTGLNLWKRAAQSIPGGNGLLSKRPERYAPDLWPTYYSKSKGVEVWDLENNKYIDMAQMGIGAAILGYCDDDVDAKVKAAIDTGVSTTLNCPEEVYLAEKLLELNPFAGSVKFTRSGGEAMSLAVRIARAKSGKDVVAFSGYHGWSDWYLAANLSGTNGLNEHLLPGLKPQGVPVSLKGTVKPFLYNDIEQFENAIDENVGVIILEGARYDFPSAPFLEAIQKKAKEKNIIIIVDEISSGFRLTDGGVYKTNGFNPDMVVYGKAMGNGYAIAAVVGKDEVMDAAQETFVSSTFWTEKVGFVAALATIEKLTTNKVWEHLDGIGKMIGEGWSTLAKLHNLKLKVTDFKPLISFKLEYGANNSKVLTYFTQEMLKRGYLAASSVYVSYAHNEKVVSDYLRATDEVFCLIKNHLEANTLDEALETRVKEDGFKRLTR